MFFALLLTGLCTLVLYDFVPRAWVNWEMKVTLGNTYKYNFKANLVVVSSLVTLKS